MEIKNVDVEKLKRLAVYGSPIAKAVAIVFLDEISEGELLRRLKKELERRR